MDANQSQDAPDGAPCQAELPESRTDRRRRKTRAALLDAGIDAIAELGFDKITIASITETADVALGTFYNHFEDRSHFLDHLFIDATMGIIDEVERTRHGRFHTEADRLAATMFVIVRRARNRHGWASFFAEALGRDDFAGGGDLGSLLVSSLERGVAQGCFVLDDIDLGARLAVGVTRQGLLHIDEHGAQEGIERTLAHSLLRTLGTPDRFVTMITERAEGSLGPVDKA